MIVEPKALQEWRSLTLLNDVRIVQKFLKVLIYLMLSGNKEVMSEKLNKRTH
ncbi:hypothetical protein [Nostoc sp. PA-18-2419]|uniref:hypothetical protein n=1 Tax=Nostoc sp. PA-18-2419 TaxID=2575443 RepID=UPI00167471D6|nr:hypothetical protein [Nostoc sp. PA-18-2419]